MKYHRSLSSDNIASRGASKIALMVASEFWRASQGTDYPLDVIASSHRARELMGILETVSMNHQVASGLQTTYRQCAWQALFRDEFLSSNAVKSISAAWAQAFENAAEGLAAEHYA